MNRQQKEVVITDLKSLMSESQAIFLVNYKGITVPQFQSLRKNVRNGGGKVRVAKATLMRIAAQELPGSKDFSELFKDQVSLVFAQNDISGLAKQLVTFSKEHETLKVLAGFYQSKVLSEKDLDFLASLPSREVLIAQLLGTVQAPIASFPRLLRLLIVQLLYALKQIEEKQAAKQ